MAQLWLARLQAATQFEDSLSAQYRSLMRAVPVNAVLDEDLQDAEYRRTLPVFYPYFDLCNEQAFLRSRRWIRRATWKDWREGIVTNLTKPAFQKAWAEVALRAPGSFTELRQIVPPKPGSGQPQSEAK